MYGHIMENLKHFLETKPCRYGMMSFFKNDNILSRSLRECGEWAQAEIDFLLHLIKPGDAVLDVGAFIGTHTLAFSQKVGGAGTVYAFEPEPTFFGVLKINIEQNALTNVSAFNAALSDNGEQAEVTEINLGNTSNFGHTSILAVGSAAGDARTRQRIEVMTIDQLALNRCDLIKIDAENMEVNVLRGAHKTLRATRPFVFAECSSLQHGWPVAELLKEKRYCTYVLDVPAYNPDNFRQNAKNFLGDGRETGLVLVPEEKLPLIRDHLDSVLYPSLIPISCIDDLALALLKKPQYKYEVMSGTAAGSVLGIDFWANETEVRHSRRTIQQQEGALAKKDEELRELHQKLARKAEEAAGLDRARSALWERLRIQQETLSRATETINQIYASHGWKALSLYYKLRDKVVPEGSLRRGLIAKLLRTPHIVWQGIRLFRDMRIVGASGLFDKDWYLQRNPDVAKASVNPLRHYLRRGASEGRDPNPYFDSDWYLRRNPDVAKAGINPLRHYIRRGALEGRNPSPDFDTKRYLHEHPDAARAGANALAHYLRSGALVGGGERPKAEEHPIESQDLPPVTDDPIVQGSELNSAEKTDWQEYKALTRQITAARQRELEKLWLEAPNMITKEDDEAFDAAKSLIFRFEKQVEVSIVIPVFNYLNFTLECLTSVMTYSNGTPYEVIVVDDGSTDRTAEILSRIGNMVYIKNERNIGFLHSCNRGAERARGEYIVFLNNDAQVTEGWLQPLLTTLRENSGVGAVGPKILYPNGRLQEAGVLVNRDGTSKLVGLFDDPGLPRYNYQREVMYCSGACLLVRASTFKDLGGFDGDFAPGYCEDCDLSFRLRERGLRLFYNPKSVVIHHLSVTSNSVDQDFKMQAVVRNRQKLSEKWQRQIDDLNKIRIIAFYLPQYHPIPENDRWWGKGFTEWTNVAKARPNFSGHYQPHVPADLGFYDLRLGHVMEEQADLAKRYGIHGFCYYYYWFAGKRLLEMPLDRILETGKPDFPFCIAWANENWTRRWDGHENEVLLAQQHSDDDDRAVVYDMMPYITHPNYIRINGRPLLIIYRVNLFPDIKRTVHVWRDLCRREGIGEIYLAFVESFEYAAGSQDPAGLGFDASIEFPPHGMPARIPPPGPLLNPQYRGVVHDYRQVVLSYLRLPIAGHARFRTAMPSWDNTSRRQNDSVVFANASPGAYQAWLEAIIQQTHEQKFGDERIVFVNAWNEWAEGNHLEPDQRNGHAFLQATRNAQEAWLMDKFADRVD